MASYYATENINLVDKLDELYDRYGYCLNTLHSFEFTGSAGFEKMQGIMKRFRESVGAGREIEIFAGKEIRSVLDYSKGLDGLPKSDVLKYLLADNCSVVVRPSGTEPKMKVYFSISAKSREMADIVEKRLTEELETFFSERIHH
jgi:phosphoglucomutase